MSNILYFFWQWILIYSGSPAAKPYQKITAYKRKKINLLQVY